MSSKYIIERVKPADNINCVLVDKKIEFNILKHYFIFIAVSL